MTYIDDQEFYIYDDDLGRKTFLGKEVLSFTTGPKPGVRSVTLKDGTVYRQGYTPPTEMYPLKPPSAWRTSS